MKSIRITALFWGALALAMIATACGPFAGPASPTTAPATTAAAAAATQAPTAVKPTSAPTTAAAATPGASATTAGTETSDIKNVADGLDKLKSYRMRAVFAFDGKDKAGQPQKGTVNVLQEVLNTTKDEHLKLDQTGNPLGSDSSSGTPTPTLTAFEMFRVSNNTFIIQGGAACQFLSSGEPLGATRAALTATQLIGDNKGRLIARGETVNGVRADHYAISEAVLTSDLAGFKLDKGDVWLSPDNFVVKIVAQVSGTNDKGSTGTGTFNYDIDNVNAQGAIVLPAGCVAPAQATDIPFPANITEKRTFEANGQSLTSFKSPDPVATVANFYRTGMPAQGWKLDSDNASGAVGVSLAFSKDGGKRTLTINIVNPGTGTTVIITDKKS